MPARKIEHEPDGPPPRAPTDGRRTAAAWAATALVLSAGGWAWIHAARNPRTPAATQGAIASNGPAAIAAQPLALSDSDVGEPLPGYEVVSPFGLRQLPWEAHPRLHAGVDIVAPLGTPVRSVLLGIVEKVGVDPGYGQYVLIRHLGSLSSLYAHLSSVAAGLEPGFPIERGAVIGGVGTTGSSTGAHLHFELRDANGEPLNPALFMNRRFASMAEWPLEAGRAISPTVRFAVVSNIPSSKLELMIAREEASLDARRDPNAEPLNFLADTDVLAPPPAEAEAAPPPAAAPPENAPVDAKLEPDLAPPPDLSSTVVNAPPPQQQPRKPPRPAFPSGFGG